MALRHQVPSPSLPWSCCLVKATEKGIIVSFVLSWRSSGGVVALSF